MLKEPARPSERPPWYFIFGEGEREDRDSRSDGMWEIHPRLEFLPICRGSFWTDRN